MLGTTMLCRNSEPFVAQDLVYLRAYDLVKCWTICRAHCTSKASIGHHGQAVLITDDAGETCPPAW